MGWDWRLAFLMRQPARQKTKSPLGRRVAEQHHIVVNGRVPVFPVFRFPYSGPEPVSGGRGLFGHHADTKKPPADGVSEAAFISLISQVILVAGIGFEPMTFRL